jgi:hypothetical protein
MIAVKCKVCSKKLSEPGGLIFSPPGKSKWPGWDEVSKTHICAQCFPILLDSIIDLGIRLKKKLEKK